MKDFTMVIPSYWGRAGDELVGSEKIVFDHPTPLNERGTLPRLLDSLDVLRGMDGKVVVIAVANDPEIASEVEERVDEIIAPYRSRYDIASMHQFALVEIKQRLAARGLSRAALWLLNLDNYAAVRNMCSLAGILNGSRHTIFIDDDEVFTDPDFLKKIEENMGGQVEGTNVEALAGYYLQPDTYRLDESRVPAWQAPYWNNAAAMNEAFDRFIGRGPRLKPTPFVFGGNMTVALEVLKSVPFDPRITRGEDIDFLLNMRIGGISFYLDRELSIKHLPPPSSRPAWKKVREDAVRFLYERKKVMDHPALSLEELQPYPGAFLGDDLEERTIKTNELLIREYESKGDALGVRECQANIAMAEKNPFQEIDTKSWLKEVTANWRELAACAEGMGIPE